MFLKVIYLLIVCLMPTGKYSNKRIKQFKEIKEMKINNKLCLHFSVLCKMLPMFVVTKLVRRYMWCL